MVNNPQNHSQDTATSSDSVLMRKIQAGLQTRKAQSVSLPKALRVTVAKVADDVLDMAMAVIGARTCDVTGDALEGEIAEDALLVLMDGTGRRRAAVTLDAALVGGLMQQQTMGSVLPAPEGEARKLTATDAAICAPFVEALLSRAAALPDDEGERNMLKGYSFGARMDELRLLLMALDAPDYTVVHLTLDLVGGTRQGTMSLILPSHDAEVLAEPEGKADEADATPPAPASLERGVLALNVELNVALTSLSMPLGDVQSLGVGDVLDLGVSSFEQAAVLTRDGRKLSRGTLGQTDGIRALQLEHEEASQRVPRRRASDRALLNLPQVIGDGTGTRAAEMEASDGMAPDASLPDAGLPPMSGLDDAGGLPSMDAVPELGELPDLPQMDGLPDLPDMSDLPGFEDEDMIPRSEAG